MQEVRPTLTSRGVRTESVPPSEGTWTFFSKMIFFEVNDLTTSRPPRSDAAGAEEAMLALWMWTTFPAAQPLRARAARTRLLHWDNIFVGREVAKSLSCHIICVLGWMTPSCFHSMRPSYNPGYKVRPTRFGLRLFQGDCDKYKSFKYVGKLCIPSNFRINGSLI